MTLSRLLMPTVTKKFNIASLPLPAPSHLLIHNLTADSIAPTVPAFRYAVANKPSLQRRARLLPPSAHFAHVSPFPLPFPFDIEPPDDPALAKMGREEFIEWWLAQREALHPRKLELLQDIDDEGPTYEVLYAENAERDEQDTVLLALSAAALRDCLPHLDTGDALAFLGSGSLSSASPESADGVVDEDSPAAQVRRVLVDVLGARAMLLTPEDADVSLAPWALRYSGHQFGQWAGQLGDGRAITILATPDPGDPDAIWEVQLKGAGRTPFSRSADGLAVVRSSIREYLCAEAMYALCVPTTRSLSLVVLPQLPVLRERVEHASITARLAPSFIRIGSFEALNPPESLYFFGGGQQEADLNALRQLAQFTAERVLKVKKPDEDGSSWVKKLLMEAVRRNAEMVAGWQAYGFMHGVINTDNVSILGLTIDYGPYAFMDVFDQMHICNHTDGEGRYAYKHQPAMILFALRQLLNALAPLIGAQSSSADPLPRSWWPDKAAPERIEEWKKAGIESTEAEMNALFHATYAAKYADLMLARLGLQTVREDDETTLVAPLLNLLADQHLDFHGAFRLLSFFKPSDDLAAFISRIFALSSRPEWNKVDEATIAWCAWLEKFTERIREERGEGEDGAEARCKEAKAKNPRFVLRQWVLEEVIARVEKDPIAGRPLLNKIMEMACSPFEPWGAENDVRADDELDLEVREERRMCGLGAKEMLGFQCSCSS